MKLAQLITGLDVTQRIAAGDTDKADLQIGSVHYRAQEVVENGLFIAVPGLKHDGHTFIDQALKRGAAAVVTQGSLENGDAQGDILNGNPNAVGIRVPDSRRAMAAIAARFYGRPSERLCVIGITGTNGKTTTAYIVESILAAAGLAVGVIGTVNYRYGGNCFPNPVTTPESVDLQRILSEMVAAGMTHVVMEVSSHAIDLERIADCFFDVAVFTNLSQDHLDYHRDMDAYWACKKRLFTQHLSTGPKKAWACGVINGGDPKSTDLIAALAVPHVTVGSAAEDNIAGPDLVCDLAGIRGEIVTPQGMVPVNSPLLGHFNVENILCAVGVGVSLGLDSALVAEGIAGLEGVPGRIERVPDEAGRNVFVDYAHTPDALENILSALKQLGAPRICCVFGCGGDRDRNKRPQMGAIAAQWADTLVITSDNPRSEDPLAIIGQIAAGVEKSGLKSADESNPGKRGYRIEPDRRKAMELGISSARAGDVVVIAGKGHENYQILNDRTIAFDDRRVAAEILAQNPVKPSPAVRPEGVR